MGLVFCVIFGLLNGSSEFCLHEARIAFFVII